jgi:hypothetical protein
MNDYSFSSLVEDPDARLFERLALLVAKAIPELRVTRTTEVIQLSASDDFGATLLFTPETLEVRLPTVEWVHGSHGPHPSTRLAQRYKLQDLYDDGDVESAPLRIVTLFLDACAARRKEFRKCRYCGASFPPEHRHSFSVCHGCAEKHRGVVH